MSVPTENLAGATAIRPFRVEVADEALDELRRRIAAARWPSRELVPDRSQGVQLATLQALTRYWTSDYDLRRVQARLNALPSSRPPSTAWSSTSSTSSRPMSRRCR